MASTRRTVATNGDIRRTATLTAVAQTIAILIGLAAISDWFIAPRAERVVRDLIQPLELRIRSLETAHSAMLARLGLIEETLQEVRRILREHEREKK